MYLDKFIQEYVNLQSLQNKPCSECSDCSEIMIFLYTKAHSFHGYNLKFYCSECLKEKGNIAEDGDYDYGEYYDLKTGRELNYIAAIGCRTYFFEFFYNNLQFNIDEILNVNQKSNIYIIKYYKKFDLEYYKKLDIKLRENNRIHIKSYTEYNNLEKYNKNDIIIHIFINYSNIDPVINNINIITAMQYDENIKNYSCMDVKTKYRKIDMLSQIFPNIAYDYLDSISNLFL